MIWCRSDQWEPHLNSQRNLCICPPVCFYFHLNNTQVAFAKWAHTVLLLINKADAHTDAHKETYTAGLLADTQKPWVLCVLSRTQKHSECDVTYVCMAIGWKWLRPARLISTYIPLHEIKCFPSFVFTDIERSTQWWRIDVEWTMKNISYSMHMTYANKLLQTKRSDETFVMQVEKKNKTIQNTLTCAIS